MQINKIIIRLQKCLLKTNPVKSVLHTQQPLTPHYKKPCNRYLTICERMNKHYLIYIMTSTDQLIIKN